MILKDGSKHACRSCITGHRSSKCVHSDRELFPIAKKGRPSNQCKACKERGHLGARSTCECQVKRRAKVKAEISGSSSSGQPGQASTSGTTGTSGDPQVEQAYPGSRKGSEDSTSSVQSQLLAQLDPQSRLQQTFAHAGVQAYISSQQPLHNQSYHSQSASGIVHTTSPQRNNFATSAEGSASFAQNPFAQYRRFSGDHTLDRQSEAHNSSAIERSPPGTGTGNEASWWTSRTYDSMGNSLEAGEPYQDSLSTNFTGTTEYDNFQQHHSAYYQGTPGQSMDQRVDSPAFTWHQNSSLYRDYMALQQQSEGYSQTEFRPSDNGSQFSGQQVASGMAGPSNSHQAPAPSGFPIDQGQSWQTYPPSQPQPETYTNQFQAPHTYPARPTARQGNRPQLSEQDSWRDTPPGLTYDSGPSRMASFDSHSHQIPTPAYTGAMPAANTTDGSMHNKMIASTLQEASQSLAAEVAKQQFFPPIESFDQVVPRSTTLELKLPLPKRFRETSGLPSHGAIIP